MNYSAIFFMQYVLINILSKIQLCKACKNGEQVNSHSIASIVVKDLEHGVTINLSEESSIKKGDIIYGRFMVPSSDTEQAALVTASWPDNHQAAPVWIFLRKDRLPNKSSFDKSSVNYITRRSSMIQVSPASSGLYYLMIECVASISKLEITVMVGNEEYIRRIQNVKEIEYLNEIDVR